MAGNSDTEFLYSISLLHILTPPCFYNRQPQTAFLVATAKPFGYIERALSIETDQCSMVGGSITHMDIPSNAANNLCPLLTLKGRPL